MQIQIRKLDRTSNKVLEVSYDKGKASEIIFTQMDVSPLTINGRQEIYKRNGENYECMIYRISGNVLSPNSREVYHREKEFSKLPNWVKSIANSNYLCSFDFDMPTDVTIHRPQITRA